MGKGRKNGKSQEKTMETRSAKRKKDFHDECKCASHKSFVLTCPGNGRTYCTKSNEVSRKVS